MDSQQTILRGKNSDIGHYMQTVQPNVFIPGMLIGTIGFYHFILLSLPGGHKVSMNKTCCLHFLTLFSSDQDEIWCADEAIQAEFAETTFE